MLAVLDHIHQLGRRVRVENPYQIQHLEPVAPLPEFSAVESAVLYLRPGHQDGALKIKDSHLATHPREQRRTLRRQAQACEGFHREVA